MTPLHRLVVYFCCVLSARCLAGQTVSWPSDVLEDKGLDKMLMTSDGKQLIISGLNGVYNINTTDFHLLNSDGTGPFNVSTNDFIRIMIYNETENMDGTVITTCSSTRDYCDVREVDDISISVHHLKPSVNVDGVAAVMATYTKPARLNRDENFLFVGCPHVRYQEHLGGRCAEPGIAWYLNSGSRKSRPWYGFMSYEQTPVLTEKYIDAFRVENFRIFFSLQRVKASNEIKSRIAQVCQHYIRWARKYTTPYTYADMPLQCGDLKEIRAVKKVTFADKVVFITVFSETTKSAVCVYTMEDIKKMFVANIKTCYRGGRPSESEDYIKFLTSTVPCRRATLDNETLHQPDDYYLCNKDKLASFHQIIGNQTLHKQPAVQYNTLALTAVTVTVKDSKIIAFLGTANGDILKAVVHPQTSADFIKQPRKHNVGYRINKDMYTSKDGRHIFVLTQRQVFKEPVESCSEFSVCGDCLQSKDPYCGWCFLENRCSTSDRCTVSEWIPASGDGKCPHVVSITPGVMSDKEIEEVNLEVSQSLHGVVVSCIFHSDEILEFKDNVSARVSDDGSHVRCMLRNIWAIGNRIKGSLIVTVSISTNVSDTPTMSGNFIMYRCETFDRCSSCTARNWTCKWCTYSNECIDADGQCGATDVQVLYGSCPQVTSYTLVSDDNSVRDPAGTVHLSQDKNYRINITGINFPTPRTGPLSYKCKIVVSRTQTLWFNRTTIDDTGNSFTCSLSKETMSTIQGTFSKLPVIVQVMWGRSLVDGGDTMSVIIYQCEHLVQPTSNCGQCKSFAIYKPYLQCQWCEPSCVDSRKFCNSTSSECGYPEITRVYPMSAHMNAITLIEIEGFNLGSRYSDTINAVTIAGILCASVESSYDPGIKIVCALAPSHRVMEGEVTIILGKSAKGHYSKPFHYQNPVVTSIKPELGPQSGGTSVTIHGKYLDTGREKNVTIGGKFCKLYKLQPVYKMLSGYNDSHVIMRKEPPKLVCKTASLDHSELLNAPLEVKVDFDGADVVVEENITYRYVADPTITDIHPKGSFYSGGRTLTIHGTNLYIIHKPMIYAVISGKQMNSEACERDATKGVMYCPSPVFNKAGKRRKRNAKTVQAKLGFEMDDVTSVTADHLPVDLAAFVYFPDPVLENFTEVKTYKELQEGHLLIKGQRLRDATNVNDILIKIGCDSCNVTSLANEAITCQPPVQKPVCDASTDSWLIVQVNIGFLQRDVGFLEYEASFSPDDNGVTKDEYIVAGSVVGFLVLCLLATFTVVGVMRKRVARLQKAEIDYKREDGNEFFYRYDVYACKKLFTSHQSDLLMSPPTAVTEELHQAMDTFKELLRNRQFLLMLIHTLEKQNSFTIHDKSNVAAILIVLNHDNMEYITGILTTLLNELTDEKIASGTPELLLIRSECVADKLLTHWLSICLYHYLKERPGSALYKLYKAIKVQTEKGPIDAISSCGRCTLSEETLLTSADTEINPVTLVLEVTHFDDIEKQEWQISVQVLDCDTITQAKNKMLEILYKNVPYSQRPDVHTTSLEIEESDRGTKRLLNDEDASSVKEGLWKRINTLQHYNVHNGAKVNLFLDRKMEASYKAGSALMTKKHQAEDDVQLASDLFLPRLANTKGTVQSYIDDLFKAVLRVGEEPSIVIKYLFDFLDSVAARCGMSDLDVLHAWKCNSLLLGFWINTMKNPEFVFDIHKPYIVDSCLSVVAQTLMDSCSTADLVLGPSSPSNKLLFAKDIPRYKKMVCQFFKEMKQKPAVSDQDLNLYLKQKVSQKFSGKFNQCTALMEMYDFTARYRNEICDEMDNLEASSPGTFSLLTAKLKDIFMRMDIYNCDKLT